MNDCIELRVGSPYRLSTTVFLPHSLMRQFYGDTNFYDALKNLSLPSDYSLNIKAAESYKSYECDLTIGSLLILELLIVGNYSDDTVSDRIREYVCTDRFLDRYIFNKELISVQDVAFAISCKIDYLSFVRRKMVKSVKNVIARYYFSKRIMESSKLAVN